MRKKWNGVFAAVLPTAACLALLVQPTRATSLARLSLRQLAASAGAVARVRCLSNASGWENGEIWTVSTFPVVKVWKGRLPEKIHVWLIGGRAGRIVSYVPGVPRFRPGEETVLFLEATRSGHLSVTAWAEGTFRIRRDIATGRELVTQDTASVPVFDPATRRFRNIGLHNLPLDQFERRIRSAVDARGNQQ